MKYSEGKQGRIFVIRLEDGDIVHQAIESFASAENVQAAALLVVGGADAGSRLVVGPEQGRSRVIEPMTHLLENVHEVAGTGTIFPDAAGMPRLHLHMACGRSGETVAGCARDGVKVWHVMEVVVFELVGTQAVRQFDPLTGFELLQP